MHFRWLKWSQEGTARVIDTEISTVYPGGNKVRKQRYRLEKKKKRWVVTSVRSWPISEQIGPEYAVFNDQNWKKLDVAAQKAYQDADMSFNRRIRELISAHWMLRAYEVASEAVKSDPGFALGWRSKAEIGFALGHVKKAIRFGQKARSLDDSVRLSEYVRSE